MFVKLSGDKWVNTGNVCSIGKETRMAGEWDTRIVYVVWFVGDNNKMVLNEEQGRELLASISAYDATRKHALSASVFPPSGTEVVRD